jgi:cell division cycle 14
MSEITDADVFQPIEVIPGRLSFTPCQSPPVSNSTQFCFTIDEDPTFIYQPLAREYGPPTILQIHNFYSLASHILDNHSEQILFFCTDNAYRFTTAACYISTFHILYSHVTASQAFSPFVKLAPCFMPFNDSSLLPPTHLLTVEGYLSGFFKGVTQGWYSPDTFDAKDYSHFCESRHGNMNWIVPGKLLALASPFVQRQLPDGYKVALPSDLIEPFKQKGITHVVRLCERLYDERVLTRAGFRHTEMFFDDGACPPVGIRDRFLRVVNGNDVVALHCRAGIGRTYF